jgi:hypothetical protein
VEWVRISRKNEASHFFSIGHLGRYLCSFTTKFNDSSILITIIPCDCLNLSLADEHVGDVTNTNHGYEFPEKMKHHIFFQSDIWADIYVVFIGLSLFFIDKTDKTNSFQ